METPEPEEPARFSQYLTFWSVGSAFAIDILQVREILPFTGATAVPLAPKLIRGLINLRGNAVAVVDLAVRFGGSSSEPTKRTCVVIVDVSTPDGDTVMGILADSVSEVIDVPHSAIEASPCFGTGVATDFLSGLAKVADDFIPILDLERVLAPERALAAVFDSPGER